ncbi:MAG: PocR ligand-binding domain-containing protein [Candidatus Omnitrophota bacterium]
MKNIKITLADLVPFNELQEMQDSFSEVANVSVSTIDANGRSLTVMSNMLSICQDKFCKQCLPAFLGGEGIIDDELSFECMPGLKHYLIPLKVSFSSASSLILGYIIVGPVIFMKRNEKEEYRETAHKMGIELDQLWSWILEFRVFSYRGIHSLKDMIENMTSRILNLAYAKMVIQKKMSGDRSARLFERRAAASRHRDEFLELFLDFVMQVARGSAGSVMLLDSDKGTLEIRFSRGLPPEVAQKTSLKLGEGISGLSAEMKKPFLINEERVDQLISDRLKKPALFSSMVVPIKFREDVYGVVNISSDKALPIKFDEITLALLTKAAGIAGVALESMSN